MRFEFATATRIIFGAGTVQEMGSLAVGFGRRALVVTGRNIERIQPLLDLLRAKNIETAIFSVASEPTVQIALDGTEQAKQFQADMIIAIGGGSALDTGKAIAALTANPGDPFDYLEVVGKGQPLKTSPLPVIAIPTTAGTGSEVTRNAVLASPEHRFKVSMRSPLMLPRIALVDPELTLALPPEITASTGMDALTQLIEPYVSNSANPLTDAISAEGIRRTARSFKQAYENGSDIHARTDMALASLFGGLALANAKLGAVHGFSGAIGGMFAAPHGAVCAALLSHVMDMNIRVAREQNRHDVTQRYEDVAYWLTGKRDASAGVEWVRKLSAELQIKSLQHYGITLESLPEIIQRSGNSSSMKGNPLKLTESQLITILENAL